MYSHYPKNRSLETLGKFFEGKQFEDTVLDTEYNDSGPQNVLFVRCAGHNCPPEIAEEIAQSGYELRTREGQDEKTTIVRVVEGL